MVFSVYKILINKNILSFQNFLVDKHYSYAKYPGTMTAIFDQI